MPDSPSPIEAVGVLQLQLVGRIALSVSVAACGCLLLAIGLATDGKGTTYREMLGSYALSGENLGPAMLLSGAAIAAFAGFMTWLVALYASFRVAGPLFRIARSLELEIERGPAAPVPIRATDLLQREWAEFSGSIARLGSHYRALHVALDDVQHSLDAQGGRDAAVARAIERFREAERLARL